MLKTDSIKVLLDRFPATDKVENLLRFLATLLLALLIADNLANLSWQLAAPLLNRQESHTLAAIPQPRPHKGAESRQRTPAEEISLFGRAETSTATTQPAHVEDAPATTLNMILKGVIAVRPMSRALAIIAEKSGNNEQLYGPGDQIPGNATIRVIYPDRVIISRNGMLETLFLEGSQPPGETESSSQSAGRYRARTANIGVPGIRPEGNGTSFDIQQDYWNKRLADLPGISRELGVRIYKENDKQVGYRLMAARGSRLLGSLGLQAGDILVSVNGRAMNSVQDGLAAYQQIRHGGQVRIEIIRNGQRESRVYNIGG